jgi:hypothetical protein
MDDFNIFSLIYACRLLKGSRYTSQQSDVYRQIYGTIILISVVYNNIYKQYSLKQKRNQLTEWSRVFLQKLIVAYLVNIFSTFSRIQSPITTLTIYRTGFYSASWRRAHKVTIYFLKIHFNILFYPRLGLQRGLLTSGLETVNMTTWNWIILEKPPVAHILKDFPIIFQSAGSLSCSQEPTTGPYPEPH